MAEHLPYDYEELAFDLYKAADDLLEDLVSMRKNRGLTQSQLANEMGVSQSYISQIENGQKQLVSLLTDYAQEVGARIKYEVEPAEKKPNGNRHYTSEQITSAANAFVEWSSGNFSSENASIQIDSMPHNGDVPRNIFIATSHIPTPKCPLTAKVTMQMEPIQ